MKNSYNSSKIMLWCLNKSKITIRIRFECAIFPFYPLIIHLHVILSDTFSFLLEYITDFKPKRCNFLPYVVFHSSIIINFSHISPTLYFFLSFFIWSYQLHAHLTNAIKIEYVNQGNDLLFIQLQVSYLTLIFYQNHSLQL